MGSDDFSRDASEENTFTFSSITNKNFYRIITKYYSPRVPLDD